jgi:hypothetical protein
MKCEVSEKMREELRGFATPWLSTKIGVPQTVINRFRKGDGINFTNGIKIYLFLEDKNGNKSR